MKRWRVPSRSIIVSIAGIWLFSIAFLLLYLDPLHSSTPETEHLREQVRSLKKELGEYQGQDPSYFNVRDEEDGPPTIPYQKPAVDILETLHKAGPYLPHWESLNSRPLPSWYDDAKFGVFIHWGLYSVPSWADWRYYTYSMGAEWYWSDLGYPETDKKSVLNFHHKNYQKLLYQDFADQFTASMWEPERWADLIKDSGAKYTVLTSKHHEGFCMWPSRWSWNWNSMDVGPKRDVVGEYAAAVRSRNITFGLYYSLYEWFNPMYLADKKTGKPPTMSHFVDEKMLPEMMDVINRYQPSVLWMDGDWEQDSPYWKSTQFLAWLYNESPSKDHIVTNDRWGHECRGNRGGYWTPADGWNPGHVIDHKWENCQTIGTSWGYNRKENLEQMKSSEALIEELITVVAYGGNYLLNLGPTSDGLIPVISEERLRQIGKFLKVNGEAIYETRPCTVQKDPIKKAEHKIWYTCKPSSKILYIFSYEWPADNQLHMISPAFSKSSEVTLLLTNEKITFHKTDDETVLQLPVFRPIHATNQPWVFKVTNAE